METDWEDPDEADLELYDYTAGPVEQMNSADEKPEVLNRLKQILNRYPEAHLSR
ncbi:MAG: hypothetical protein U5K69_08600 [Balneolaceae bacterium]|nr:hypothetical protein [Balneolaceae bacterium]